MSSTAPPWAVVTDESELCTHATRPSRSVTGVPPLSPLQFRADPAADLDRVEATLRDFARADDEFLTEIATHLIPAGGKRLRPSFVIAAALVGAEDPLADEAMSSEIVKAAVSVELVHLGSLYHDDVMDDAATRRHLESVNHRWGNLRAILAGDLLLARASEVAASLGTEVAALLASTIARLCEGQVRELQRIYDTTRSEDAYLLAIEGKTAALYATSCRIGALVGGLDREEVDLLTEFGQLYGMAFQIVDDVLDLVSTEEQLGKPAGNDLREGVYTLPVIRELARDPDGELASLLGQVLDDDQRQRARDLVLRGGRVADTIDVALAYTDQALGVLGSMEASPAVEGMRAAAKNLLVSLPN